MPEYGAETRNFKNDNSPRGSAGTGSDIPVTTYSEGGTRIEHKAVTAAEVQPVRKPSKRGAYDEEDDGEDE